MNDENILTTFRRAKEVRIQDVIAARGIPLRGRGADRCGPCPRCGGRDRFAINVRKRVFLCRQCGGRGDVIDLVAFLDNCDRLTAARALINEPKPKTNGGGNGLERAIAAKKRKQKQQPKLPVVPAADVPKETPKEAAKKITAATFEYTDENGIVIYAVDRLEYQNADGSFVLKDDGKRMKSFRQRRPDPDRPGGWIANMDGITRVPYRLPELIEAVAAGQLIYIVEGEGCVEALRGIGCAATTNAGGAGKWGPDFNKYLNDADVVLLPDADPPGQKHMDDVAASLVGIAARTRVLALPGLPAKGDVVEWLAAGGTREELDVLVEAAPDWQPPSEETSTDETEAETAGEAVETASWDDPDFSILEDRRGELPEFPTDVFSPDWQVLLERMALGAGVRVEHVVIPLLGVASSLIGTARRVRASRGWSQPMTVWAVLVAPSGERKTPGIRATTRALDLIEMNNTGNSEKRLKHETVVQKAKEAMKKWKDEREAALTAKPPTEPPPMPIGALDPGNFIEPRLYATDPTIERLAALLCARPRGMMLIRDELSGLFANMHRYSGGSDRPFWLEAWNGERHIVERVSGSVVVKHLLVGVIGGFQPDKLQRAFAGDEDGMSARFLYAWPLAPDYRKLSNDATEIEPDLVNVLTALIRLPSEDDKDLFVPQDVWLSDGAVADFEVFREWHDKTKRGIHDLEKQWFLKGEAIVLRLAGTLSYLTWAAKLGTANSVGGIVGAMEPINIEPQFIAAAIHLWRDFFWPHARAALRQIGMSDRHRNARRALQWIKTQKRAEVSREDIRRDALGQRLDAEETEKLIDGLVNWGWLRELPSASGPKGGKPARRWAVNPKLLSAGGG